MPPTDPPTTNPRPTPSEPINSAPPSAAKSVAAAVSLRPFVVGAALTLGLAITAQVAVDPYRVWGAPEVSGINLAPVGYLEKMRMGKAYEVRRANAEVLILGTSRTQLGLPLDAPQLRDRRAFAMTLEAATPYETRRYLEVALRHNPVRTVILGMEFTRWVANATTRDGYDEARLEPRPTVFGWPIPTVDDALAAGLSWDALNDVIATLRRNLPGDTPTYSQGSAARWERRDGRFRDYVSTRKRFDSKLGETRRHIGWFTPKLEANKARDLQHLVAIAKLCAARGIALYAFLSPAHSSWYDLIAEAGLERAYASWREDVRATLAQAHPTAQLWDFAGRTPFTTEPAPTKAAPSKKMKWYWEASHYRPELGDLLLDAMLAAGGEARAKASGLGVRLR